MRKFETHFFVSKKRGIKYTAFFKKILLRFLKFNNEAFSGFTLAIDIENSSPIHNLLTQLVRFLVLQILYFVVVRQQTIQKINQQVFVDFLAKKLFEPKIGEWVDVTGSHKDLCQNCKDK